MYEPAAAEITVSHVLIQMLAMPRSDCGLLPARAILAWKSCARRWRRELHNRPFRGQLPGVFPDAVEWLKEGWLLASAEMQHSELAAACCCWPCCIRRCVIYRLLRPAVDRH